MKRFSIGRLLWLVLVLSCQPQQPTLDVTVGAVRVDVDATVSVTATAGDGAPGTGTVDLTTSLGVLEASSLALVDGAGRTRLRCPRGTSGCTAGGSIDVTARWTTASGVITQTATVRVTDPPVSDGGGVVDAGRDGGAAGDAGLDGGRDAGEPDAGVFLEGTPLQGAEVLVVGRMGPPRTVGFAPMTLNANMRVGFDRMPEHPAIYNDRLAYVRNGVAYLWTEDPLDAGDVDGGELDGGDLDGGVDAGPTFGAFPLFRPEANDAFLASCSDEFADPDAGRVMALVPTLTGGLWVGCGDSPDSGVVLYLKGGVRVSAVRPAVPLAASDDVILARAPDGGVLLIREPSVDQVSSPRALDVASSARGTASGFEVLSFNQATNACSLGVITRTGGFTELPLPVTVPQDRRCLGGRFAGRRDALLYPIIGQPAGYREVGFLRPAPPADGGLTDGGVTDGGPADGGLADAGAVDAGSHVVFEVTTPSDFNADPPVLTIDFMYPVEVVAKP